MNVTDDAKNKYRDHYDIMKLRRVANVIFFYTPLIVLENVPAEKDGSKVLNVLCESATMDQALKSIIHLHTRQSNRIVDPNTSLHLRKSKAIKDMLAKYTTDLVIGELVNHRNWSASCGIRNTYTIDQHIRYVYKRC